MHIALNLNKSAFICSPQSDQTKYSSSSSFSRFFENKNIESKRAELSKPENLANTLMVFFHGSALLARSGKSSDQLKAVFEKIMANITIIK